MSASLVRLRALLSAQGGLMASLLSDGGAPGSSPDTPAAVSPARLVLAGPRARAGAEEYELVMEAIYEGYLLHYEVPRLVCPRDADVGLLAGDQLYALGLDRLVALGDLPAVGELADVITLTALAQGSGDRALADAVWTAGARAVGWGATEAHGLAKGLARAGSPEALAAMRACGTEPS
jgi:hypothetical protein